MDVIRDKNAALNVVSRNGMHLRFVCEDLKNDTEIVLAAVRQNGLALEHAPDDIKNNTAVVVAAVRQNSGALYFAADAVKHDKRVVLIAVRKRGGALYHASAALKADREVVLAAVRHDGWALEHASPELRDDRDVILCAVQQSGWALTYASERLRNDADVVLTAISQSGCALRHASHALKANAQFVTQAVQTNQEALPHVPEPLRSDARVIQAADTGRAMLAVARAADVNTPHPKRSLSPSPAVECDISISASSSSPYCQTSKQRGSRRIRARPATTSTLSGQCNENGAARHPPDCDYVASNQEIRRLRKIIVDLRSNLDDTEFQNRQLREETSRNCAVLTALASFEREAHIKIRELYTQNLQLHAENTRLFHARVIESGRFPTYSDSNSSYQHTLHQPRLRQNAVSPAVSNVDAEGTADSTAHGGTCAPEVV